MKLLRRQFLLLATGAAAMSGASLRAPAQDAYPARPVRIVVGYTAGGVSDILARLVGQRLSERLGQPFVIEDRPGAASNVAADYVVHAPADGYTLFLAGISNAINVSLYPELDFNFAHDMAPVAIFSRSPLVMEVGPSFPAKIPAGTAHNSTFLFPRAAPFLRSTPVLPADAALSDFLLARFSPVPSPHSLQHLSTPTEFIKHSHKCAG